MSVSASIESNYGVSGGGARRRVIALLNYSAEAYSSGYALAKELFGFKVQLESILFLSAGTGSERMYKWDKGNQSIRIYDEDGGGTSDFAEVTSALSEAIRVEAVGY